MATFTGQKATNNTFTGTAAADLFLWAAADLNSLDKANGGGGVDTLRLTTAGPLVGTAPLAGITGIEQIALAAGGNALTLANGNFAGVAGARINVIGGAGNDTVNASGLTGANRIDVTAGAGMDVLRGGAGADIFRFAAGGLAGDTVVGGLGTDRLVLTTAGPLAAGALAKLSGVEVIDLAAGGNTLSFINDNFTGAANSRISVMGSAGSDVVDGSLVGAGRRFVITAGAGNDVLRGGAGADTFRFRAADLAFDTVRGGAGLDTLQLTSAGVLALGALANLSDVETLQLAEGGNAIKLINANLTGVSGGRITVRGGAAGNDVVNASELTGARAVDVTAGAGLDVLRGGTGNDIFRFKAADLAGDAVVGGRGTDRLVLTTAGPLAAGALAKLSGVEVIDLAAGGNTLSFINGNFTGATNSRISVMGSAGSDVVNGSLVDAGRSFVITAGAGNDVLRGGAGDDVFRFAATALAGDTVSGGEGRDTLQFTTAGTITAAALANVTGVETIRLANGTNSLTLGNANVGNFSTITVIGGSGNDTVDGSGLTGDRDIEIIAGGGNDVLRGGAAGDVFAFAAAELTASDTVAGGGGRDLLLLLSAGEVTAAGLANVSGIEVIYLAAGGNSLTLTDAIYAGVVGLIPIQGTAGASSIDGSALTGSNGLYFRDGGGADTLKGGAGVDILEIGTGGSVFVAGDTFDGGGGDDAIFVYQSMSFLGNTLTNVERLVASSFAGVNVIISGANAAGLRVVGSGTNNRVDDIFTVQLSAGSITDLSNLRLVNADAADAINVVSLGGAGTATQVTLSSSIARFTGGEGSDSVTDRGGMQAIALGGGGDEVRFEGGNLFAAGDTIDGGGGDDSIVFDRSMDFLGNSITNVEQLSYKARAAANVAISGENAARLRTITNVVGLDGFTQTYTVRLTAGSTTNLSNLTLLNRDAGDAINVVSLGGAGTATQVTLSSSIARFTGGEGGDTVSIAAMNLDGDSIQGGGGYDILRLLSGGLLEFDDLAKVTGVEEIVLSAQGNSLTLTDANIAVPLAEVADQIVIQSSAGTNTIDAADLTKGRINVADAGGIDTIKGGARTDTLRLFGGNTFRTGDSFDGGAGVDRIIFDRSMNFLGNTLTSVEQLLLFGGASATVTISGENAAQLTQIGSLSGPDTKTQTYTVQLSPGSTTDLSKLTLINADAGDAIHVVATAGGGDASLTLSGSIASFIGTGSNETVSFAPSGGYLEGVDIDGGSGADRITFDGNRSVASLDGGANADTLVLRITSPLDPTDASKRFTIDLSQTGNQNRTTGGKGGQVTNFERVDASASTVGVTLTGPSNAFGLLTGGSGADTITAGAGGAEIIGGLGPDLLTGGTSDDFFILRSTLEAQGDIINGGGGSDEIILRDTTDLTGATISGVETLTLAAVDAATGFVVARDLTANLTSMQAAALTTILGNGLLAASVETLVVNLSGSDLLDLSSLAFNDWSDGDLVRINGTEGDDTITGTRQNDVIVSGGGGDTLSGGDGDDVIGYDLYHSRGLAGDAGIDTVRLDSTDFTDTPQAVTVDLAAGTITEVYSGTNFQFDATGFENADFSRNVLNTTLIGTEGANTLIGGSAADTITGGLGADRLTGGGGVDRFVWNSKEEGGDTITDFVPGTDELVFSSAAFGFTDASFDRVVTSISDLDFSSDLFILSEAASIQMIKNQLADAMYEPDKNMFFIAPNFEGHQILYYSPNAKSFTDKPDGEIFFFVPEIIQIADLGIGPTPGLSDFVFI